MLRTCSRLIALTAMVTCGLVTAQAANRLTLACKGVETTTGGISSSEQVSMGVIVDFQKKVILGLGLYDLPIPITGIDETTVFFAVEGKDISGTLDRVTGALDAKSITTNLSTQEPMLWVTLTLRCKPAQRMF
jgi:hypothetical protein